MSEKKIKQYNRARFLEVHKRCVYCGAQATTTDHCPPRCFFQGREWPETYEFPACEPCNAEARLDEQALAVLIRCRSMDDQNKGVDLEWERLVKGVRNNQPAIIEEWNALSASVRKRSFRQMFGSEEGDRLRLEGWGMANIGPLTQAAITRFMVKLGKALFYRHNEILFEGVIYAFHTSLLAQKDPVDFIGGITKMAPEFAISRRNTKSLSDQFIYRYNYSPRDKVLYAVVQFSEQFVFQLMVLGTEMAVRLESDVRAVDEAAFMVKHRHECRPHHTNASVH